MEKNIKDNYPAGMGIKKSKFILYMLVAIALTSTTTAKARTDLPLPRFVSVKQTEMNIRTGPGVRYPVKWLFKRKNSPVEVIAEFDQWRKIRDIEGDEGWAHLSQLSGKRTVVTVGKALLLRKHSLPDAAPLARIEEGVHANLISCSNDACRIETGKYKGWIDRKNLWGVYPKEIVN